MFNYYPKNFKANGWGWHRGAGAAAAVSGFLSGERGGKPKAHSSLYPSLPTEDDTVFNAGMKLYPALPQEEYESGAVEEVVEEACASVNVSAMVSCFCFLFIHSVLLFSKRWLLNKASIKAVDMLKFKHHIRRLPTD